MALTTNFNANPYYDDYDETKGYYRILFRPGYALQAREVTQLQTILQKQIERHGSHLFEDGSVVLGCELNYDNEVKSLKLESAFSGADITVSDFANGIITGGSSNARARVVQTEASTATEQPTLMFHYLNNNTFNDGETITVAGTTTQANTVSSTGASGVSGAVANGSVVSINSGVFYVGGFFVFKEAETLTLEKYASNPSYRVGIQVTESTVSSDTDTTLLDPAQGAYNFAAQGATRYKIQLDLSKKTFSATDPVEANADENFFQLLKVSNGAKLEETKYPVYTELEKTLARRTYDESGDYTVTPFNLQLTTHQGITGTTANSGPDFPSVLTGNGTNFITDLSVGDKVFLSGNTAQTAVIASISNSTYATLTGTLDTDVSGQTIQFESKLSAGLDPGKAYVKGFEYESISTKYVTVDKGRESATVNNYGLNTSFGNKLYIKNANGFFDISRHELIDLHSVNSTSQATGSTKSQTIVGTARVRDMDYYSASGNTSNVSHSHSDYVLYLYDIRTTNNKTGNTADVARDSTGNPWVLSSNSSANTFVLRKDVITIGVANTGHVSSTDYRIGGTTTNSSFDLLSTSNGAYVGATVTIVSANPEKLIGEDLSSIALENPNDTSFDSPGGGVLVTEQQNTITTTTYTRNIVDYIANSTVSTVILDSEMSDRVYFVANSSGGLDTNYLSSGTETAHTFNPTATFDVKFQIKDVKSISGYTTGARVSYADVDELSKYNFTSTANTILKETQFNSLIYPLPDQPLSLANNLTFTYKTVDAGRLTDGDGVLTINLSDLDTFPVTGEPISESQAEENFLVVVLNSESDTTVSNGQYLSFSNTDGYSRTINVTSTTAVIDCNTSAINVAVTYTAKRSGATGSTRTKTIAAGNGNTAFNYDSGANTLNDHVSVGQYFVTSPTRVVGEKIQLPVADVFNIVKIVDSGDTSTDVTNTMMTATANNITSRYALDTGQKDNYYDHSSVYLKPGQTPPSGRIVVVYDRFVHSGKGYLTVNSYPTTGTFNNGQNTFSYGNIPSYTSPSSGETYRLSDVIDFRPQVQKNVTGTTYDVATDIDAIANSSILLPDSDTTTTLDYSYYLPRIDKLVLSRDRQFKVIKGKSATNPVTPPDDEDSMTLYTLKVPAYTFALTDIETRYIDNKRFTMRDIGKLEKRIERLEYFTSLNILEKETAARDITSDGSIDSLFNTTGSRFKSGILVDPFAGHSIGDVTLDDYNASVHFAEKQLRPPFYYDNFRFSLDTESSNNVVKTGDLVTLPYTNTSFIEQPLTSNTTFINPFNIVNFIGSLKVDPPSDTWFDDSTRPDVTTNVEGHHDNWVISSSDGRKGFGSQWDDWSVNWSGKQINPEPNTAVANVGSTSVGTRSTKLISQNKSKFGITSEDPVETIVKTVGNKKLDLSVVPYVRSQRVSFSAKGLKPLTNVYVYVGSTDMSANTEPAKKLVLGSANGAFQEGEIVQDSANNRGIVRIASNTVSNVSTLFITDITGNTDATAASPVTSQNNRVTNSGIGFATSNVVTGLTSGANGTISSIVANTRNILSSGVSIMQTDDNGAVAGDINIPAGTFRTGDRLIRITDHSNNELGSTTTVAETFFKAKGVLQNREKLLVSTREPIVRRESIGSEEIVTDTTTRQTSQTNWVNPMAQSFTVDASTYPMGIFLRDLTLFFSAKDTYLPVTVQIRPLVNGYPSSSMILPFSEVTLNPDKVQTSSVANASSSNTSTSTTFSFESPVYLTPDEYAIVVVSNSPEYKLYTATHGVNSTGTTRKISKQPFVGSFFRPQNAGVWEAKKEEFLMFRMNRCNFTGTGGANNYATFISHANGAVGNTANVQYQTFKTTASTVEFSNTTMDFTFESFNTSNTSVGYSAFSLEQNINLNTTRQMTSSTNGMFNINATMSTSNSHVSPVIDLDRLNLIVVENNIDNAGLSANDIVVTTTGAGYTNTSVGAFTATVSSPDLTSGITTTANVYVDVTLPVASDIESANADYTVAPATPGQFVVGEGVVVVANNSSGTVTGSQADNAAFGVIVSQTYVDSDESKNVASITIRTSANTDLINSGVFANDTCVISSSLAQDAAHTNTLATGSNTFFKVGTVTGIVSNVIPHATGSGYLTTPTITISTPSDTVNGVNAVANVVGEDSSRGGNINAKYISRRVTLEDGFDSSDLKVIVNAYKPLGTGVHVYYKVKSDDDPQDFDDKNYVLMTQETPSSVYSGAEGDIKEYVYRTANDSITYTSDNVTYDKFKTFAVKIVMTSNNATVVPKVRDMRAIALDD